jgi:hypothetical protein
MSKTTLNSALRQMGYTHDEMVTHGFRTIASTFLHGFHYFNETIIEFELEHLTGSKTKWIYDRGDYLDYRKIMMQFYADYLDSLRDNILCPELPELPSVKK